MILSRKAHDALIQYVQRIQSRHINSTEFREKLAAMDLAYAKHLLQAQKDCEDEVYDKIRPPIVASEVETMTSELANIFVNRSPLFKVLGDDPEAAFKLQALIEKQARYHRWGRQLLLFINRAVRYNISAIDAYIFPYDDVTLATSNTPELDGTYETATKVSTGVFLYAPSLYNTIIDDRPSPADIPFEAEYSGYNQVITRTRLKQIGNLLSANKQAINLDKAYASVSTGLSNYYFTPPDISEYISSTRDEASDWLAWLGLENPDITLRSSDYLLTTLYLRIIPKDFGIKVPRANTPQVFRLLIVNNSYIISIQEVATPFNSLGMLFCDLREDGLGWQTKSYAENIIPFQDVATDLLSIRLEGSRRALNDRAIYDPQYLSPSDVNSPTASAKIPLRTALRQSGDRPPLSSLYYPIPFDERGTQNALTDMSTILRMKDDVNGVNFALRGQQVPGNRTKAEFDTLASAAQSKVLPAAIRLEEQVFTLLKLMIKMHILSTLSSEQVYDMNMQQALQITPESFQDKLLEFKITDGLQPKTAIRDPNVLSTALQFMQNTPELAQAYSIPDVFADMLQVLDIDISRHRRQPNALNTQPNQTIGGGPNAGAPTAPTGAPEQLPSPPPEQLP